MADQITITLPDGSTRDYPRGRPRARSPHRSARASPRRRSRPGSPPTGPARRRNGSTSTGPSTTTRRSRSSRPPRPRGARCCATRPRTCMAQAVTDLFPGAKYAIGPAIEDGFYYDFELPDGQHFTDDDLERIEARMREIVGGRPAVRARRARARRGPGGVRRPAVQAGHHREGRRFRGRRRRGHLRVPQPATRRRRVRRPLPRTARAVDEAPRRVQAARRSPARTGGATSTARCCSGSTARPGSRRPRSTEHLHRLEEAERRDHRRLGAELDLFSFPEEIGSGLAVFHPEGRAHPQAHGGLLARAPRGERATSS